MILLVWCVFSSCKRDRESDPATAFSVEAAFPHLTFERPVDLQNCGDGRVFVVEQEGRIHVFAADAGVTSTTVFLDIRALVDDSGNEEGLLGLAFHPNYKSNGTFYVNYTASNPDRTVIARYTVSSDSNAADPASASVVLEFSQPYSNHNGGQIAFGPDGYLYIGTGDGGSGGDPQGNGQSLSTLLGKILRIDVNTDPYGIPADNPFVGQAGVREEIYAYGLRNVWRFSFDPETGLLWCGDVGQNKFEEIDLIRKGGNYGWNTMEGFSCYNAASCDTAGLILPILDYPRSEGISVTGGHVYRGTKWPDLIGAYVYADFGTGKIWSIRLEGNRVIHRLLVSSGLPISSFGVDASRELYLCSFDGKIYKIAS